MRRPVAGVWDVPSAGVLPALVVIGVSFFLGGLGGCILSSCIEGGGGERLVAYLQGFLSAAKEDAVSAPALLPLVWETVRWPLLTVLLGFTALGILGLPMLFAVRGFLLSFSITSFIHMFGTSGSLLAFLVFGISGCISIPALFVLGVQSLMVSRRLAGHFLGEERREVYYGKPYFVRCGLCAVALAGSVLLEYLAVPTLVAGAARIFAF